jgi:hypothetical protein
MSTRPEEESPRDGDENPRRRTILLMTSILFILAGGLNLLIGEWLSAAFFLAGGFVFLKGREIDRWPKAARVLVIVALALLAVAMFIRLIQRFKAFG